jgi:hypothetical protein
VFFLEPQVLKTDVGLAHTIDNVFRRVRAKCQSGPA